MQAAAVAEFTVRPPRRRERTELHEAVPHVPEAALRFREAMAEAVVRSMWLQDLTSTDIRKHLSGFRSCELGKLKAGDVSTFGANKLMTLAQLMKCKFRLDVIPPASPARAPDDRIGILFRLLGETDDACQAAYEEVGARSYPLTRVAVRQAGTQCMLAIDAIRRGPEFWYREGLLFSAMLFSAEQMLEAVKTKGRAVAKAIAMLRETATLMEDIADGIRESREASDAD
jgi:hypothetical protein